MHDATIHWQNKLAITVFQRNFIHDTSVTRLNGGKLKEQSPLQGAELHLAFSLILALDTKLQTYLHTSQLLARYTDIS